MGDQLFMEGLQRCLAYCSLRELVPQDDGSCEDGSIHMIILNLDCVSCTKH